MENYTLLRIVTIGKHWRMQAIYTLCRIMQDE